VVNWKGCGRRKIWSNRDIPPVALHPLPGLGLLFRFRNLIYTYGRTPWMSDQLIARPLPTQDNTNIE
jgi:hypothetical protein